MNQETIQTMMPGLAPGDKLVHFEVQEQLASGGQGIVWKGYDRLLNRFVAIKQIASASDVDEIFREKFRHEADIQKRISTSHPNIVDVIDCVDDPRGLFTVMEFVDGVSLDRALNQMNGPIDTLQALKILRDAAMALTAIHGAGILHRDLKPGNILIAKDGTAKVCDFGIATLVDDQEAMALGTAQYMAPEAFTEDELDARADIYSLGIIAYEMLVGRNQFNESFKAVMRDKRHMAMRWMKWHTNPRVTAPKIRESNPNVPDVLEELIERTMSKNPAQRIATAEQLIDAIKSHFSKSGAAARSAEMIQQAAAANARQPSAVSHTADTAEIPKKSKLPLIIGIIVGVQVLGGVGWYLWDQNEKTKAVNTAYAKHKSEFDRAFDVYKTAKDRASYTEARESFEGVAKARQKVQQKDALGFLAAAYQKMAEAQLQRLEAEEKAIQAHDLSTDADDTDGSKWLKARDNIAAIVGHYEAALGLVSRAEEDVKEISQGAKSVKELRNEVQSLQSAYQYQLAFFNLITPIYEAVRQNDNANASKKIFELSDSLQKTARESNRAVLKIQRDIVRALRKRVGINEDNVAIAAQFKQLRSLQSTGKYQEALSEISELREEYKDSLDFDHDRLDGIEKEVRHAIALRDAKEDYLEIANKADKDLTRFIEVIDRYMRLLPAGEEEWKRLKQEKTEARSMRHYHQALALEASNPQQAEEELREAVRIWAGNIQASERLKALGMSRTRKGFVAQGNAQMQAGQYEAAIVTFKKAQGIGSTDDVTSKIQQCRVRIHAKAGNAALASGAFDKARAEFSKGLEIDATDSECRTNLAKVELYISLNDIGAAADALHNSGNYSKAIGKYREALKMAKQHNLSAVLPVINKKIAESSYQLMVVQLENYIKQRQWVGAKATLSSLKKQFGKRVASDNKVSLLEQELKKNAPK